MHYDDIIEPIYKDFENYYEKFIHSHEIGAHVNAEERARGAAFFHALADNLEQFSVETNIDRCVLERTGYEIGKLINKNEKCQHIKHRDSFLGKNIKKTVVCVMLNKG